MPRPSSNIAAKAMTLALLRTSRRLAAEVGNLLARRARKPSARASWRKGEGDFVTALDIAAERRLRRLLEQLHPDHGFLGEESGGRQLEAAYVWVVDPVDGTSNMARGLAPFAVSVACLRAGQPVAAAVLCQPEGALYSAAWGHGAFRNSVRIRPATPVLDDRAILGVQWVRGVADVPFLPALLRTGARVRNFGCTVAQLCDAAMGRLDANIQIQGKIWDIVAAGLIATEAGCAFTDWRGRPLFPLPSLDGTCDYPSVAARAPVHARLVRILAAPSVSSP